MITAILLALGMAAAPITTDWSLIASDSAAKWLPLFAGAPALRDGVLRWRYNPAGEPGPWVLAELQAAAVEWGAVCGVRIAFAGLTRAGFDADGISTVSWQRMDGYGGYATGWLTEQLPSAIAESDIALNPDALTTPELVRTIARHEFGHALGLAHSDLEGAAMSGPPHSSYAWPYAIGADDVQGCRALYGEPGTPPIVRLGDVR